MEYLVIKFIDMHNESENQKKQKFNIKLRSQYVFKK